MEAKEPIAWTLDGENGGLHKVAEIKNLHKTVVIRVDEGAE